MIKNIILLIVLVCQLAVWFIVDPPWKKEPERSEKVNSKAMAAVPVEQVEFIETHDVAGRSLKLGRRNGVWVVENLQGFPAMPQKVSDALEELKDLAKADFRSDKSVMHENFEVDVKKGLQLKLFGANRTPLADLVIGKNDVQGKGGTFVRRADDNDVYVARSPKLSVVFSGDPFEWIRRGMMDVDLADQQRMADLKNACFRFEVEGRVQKKGADGRFLTPAEYESVRYVYARDPNPPADGGEPIWHVVEPDTKASLEIADLQIKNMIQNFLAQQILMNQTIVGPGVKPEQKLGADDEKELKVIARFKEGELTTVRTLEVGAEFDAPSPNGQPPAKQRFARVSHPGKSPIDALQQTFTFSVTPQMPMFFLREPETMVRRETPKAPAPTTQPQK